MQFFLFFSELFFLKYNPFKYEILSSMSETSWKVPRHKHFCPTCWHKVKGFLTVFSNFLPILKNYHHTNLRFWFYCVERLVGNSCALAVTLNFFFLKKKDIIFKKSIFRCLTVFWNILTSSKNILPTLRFWYQLIVRVVRNFPAYEIHPIFFYTRRTLRKFILFLICWPFFFKFFIFLKNYRQKKPNFRFFVLFFIFLSFQSKRWVLISFLYQRQRPVFHAEKIMTVGNVNGLVSCPIFWNFDSSRNQLHLILKV